MKEQRYIGVDLGGTNIAVGVVTEDGTILHKKSVPTGAQRPFTEIAADMAACIRDVVAEAGLTMKDIRAIGIGSPGTLNDATGVMVYANNFRDGSNVPLRALMQRYFDLPIRIGNDANVAALGETIAGAAKGKKNVVMVTLGTGVGGGIIIDGKIYEGLHAAGAEIGHIMLRHAGEPCTCGRRGCWEAYASATALVRQTREAMRKHPESLMNETPYENVNGRTAFDAARRGDRTAKRVVNTYIKYVAEGLVDLVNIFRPEVLIIGGGICNEGDFLLKPLKKLVYRYSYGAELNEKQDIEVAKCGNDAGIIGAALIAR